MNDDDLDEMRTEPKRVVRSSRDKPKGQHIERQHDCEAEASASRQYRVFVRRHVSREGIFSAGLTFIRPNADLILCRYNSGHHPHRNILERERLSAQPHIHLATARYLQARLDSDGFAVATDRYKSVNGALRCLVIDCNIRGVLTDDDLKTDDMFEQL